MRFFEVQYRRGELRKKTVLEAENRLEAMKSFKNMSVGVPVNMREISEPLGMKVQKVVEKQRSPLKNRRVNTEAFIAALRQLAVMLDAGMPVNDCFSEAVKSTEDPMLRMILASMLEDIEGGMSLTDAAKPFRRQLGSLSISMFHLGEQTGNLTESINKLADILQAIHDNRLKLKKATRYPLFTIFAMAVAFSIVIVMVVPQFEELFARSDVELPFPTRFLLWIENAMISYGPYIIVAAFLLAAIFGYFYKRNEKVRLEADRLLLKVYIVGPVTRYAMLGRFVYIFTILNRAGIPIVDALHAAIGVVENSYMKQQLSLIVAAIEEGRSLYDGFEDSGLFISMILQMIKAGEEAGALSNMMEKVSKYYQDRYAYLVDSVATMIEPLLIAAIAGFVLVLALGIFLPMWSMADAMGI